MNCKHFGSGNNHVICNYNQNRPGGGAVLQRGCFPISTQSPRLLGLPFKGGGFDSGQNREITFPNGKREWNVFTFSLLNYVALYALTQIKPSFDALFNPSHPPPAPYFCRRKIRIHSPPFGSKITSGNWTSGQINR